MALSLRTLVIFLFLVGYSLQSPLPPASDEEKEEWEDTEEGRFLEGYIVVGPESIPVTDFRSHVQRNLVAAPRLLWPDRRVFYDFSAGFPDALRGQVAEALDDLAARTCVRFARRSGQKTYLKLRATGKGCATKVGFQDGARGPLDLHVGGRRCHTRGTIQHEFLHALGFWHEHTRPDRDRFVTVHWDRVRPGKESNFVVRLSNETAILGLPYDFASVMHYKPTAFGRNRGEFTLEPKVKVEEARRVMGQRLGVTKLDVAKLNRLYNCSGGSRENYYRGDEWEGKDVVIGEVEEPEPRKVNGEVSKGGEILYESMKKEDATVKMTESALIEKILVTEIIEKVENVKEAPCSSGRECIEMAGPGDGSRGEGNCGMTKSKFKRQVLNAKPQVNEKETNPQNSHPENFAPQKILPELLKGVLDKENDRPIVIQFAIYQPIVYKTANETEEKSAESNSGAKSGKEQAATENMASKRMSEVPPDQRVHEGGSDGDSHDDIDLRSSVGSDDYRELRRDKTRENPAPANFETRPDPSRDYVRQQLPDVNTPRVPFTRPDFPSSNTRTDYFGHEEQPTVYKSSKKEFSRSPSRYDDQYSPDHAEELNPLPKSREFEDDHFTYPSKEPIQPLQASKKNDYLPPGRVSADSFGEPTKHDEYFSSPRDNPRAEPQETTVSKQAPIGEIGYSPIQDERPSRYDANRKDYPAPHSETPADVPSLEGHFDSRDDGAGHNSPSANEDRFLPDHDARRFGFSQDSQPKDHSEDSTAQYPQSYEAHEAKNDNRDFLVIGQKSSRDRDGPVKLGKNGPFPQEYAGGGHPPPEEKRERFGSPSRTVKVKVENVAPDWKGEVETDGRAAASQNDFRREPGSRNADGQGEIAKFEEKAVERDRAKSRPDLSLEEDFNDKLDQERRKKLLEKAPEDGPRDRDRAPLPTTNLQKQSSDRPRETRVSVVRTLLSSRLAPARRTAAKNPKRDLQDEMPPDPVEPAEDDIFISKPMVNLYPHQALPLRACVSMEALQAQAKASR